MMRVARTAYDHYSLWTACDAQGTDNEGYPKSWFYFEVGGFCNRRVTFSVHRVHFLYAMVSHRSFRPNVTRCTDQSTESATRTDKFQNGTVCPTQSSIFP
jgi:hypothetical protein